MDDTDSIPARKLISVRVAHDRTGIPTRTLYRWAASGLLRTYSIGGMIFIHEDDVSRLEAA